MTRTAEGARRVRPALVVAAVLGMAAFSCACAAGGASEAATISRAGNECEWHTVPTPNPAVGSQSQLVAVTAPSPRTAWAVGNSFSGEAGPSGTFVERWDGSRWELVPVAVPEYAFLADVSADGPRDVWIAGSGNHPFVARWDGRMWRRTPVPVRARYAHLFGIDARAPDDVWAVGNRSDGHTGRTLVVHWDGRRWRVVPSPSPPPSPRTSHPYATLEGVTVISRNDAWAVGESGNVAPAGQSTTLILHWNGIRWSKVASPNIRNHAGESFDMLFSVDAAGPRDAWAVGSWNTGTPGFGGLGDNSLAEHWDGRRWRVARPPHLPERHILYDVVADDRTVWTVGDRRQPYRTLVERRAGRGWRVEPARAGSLGGIAAAPDGRLWAVGQRHSRTLALTCTAP